MSSIELLLADLVAMRTITGNVETNDAALNYIERFLAMRGMHCKRYRFDGQGALLASTRLDNLLTPTILLAAHIDVVDGSEALFTLRQEGDKLLGRGVYDMKFSIAGYLQIVDDLTETLDDYNFGIMITTDEESTDVGVKSLIRAGLRPNICILPDSTAPGWDIETVAKGYWRFDMIANGSQAHGGRPWEGESASFKLIHALHDLKTSFEGQHTGTDSLNIGKIHGGDAHNVVPSEMRAGIDIRFLSKQNLREKRAMIDDLCKKHDVTYQEIVTAPPVITDLNHPLVQKYSQSVKTITGKTPQSFISCAGTDAPYFYDIGIQCIISCCEGGKHHTEDEWISRKSFLQFVPILHDFLNRAAKAAPASVDKTATVA